MSQSIMSADVKTDPWWWEDAPRPPIEPVELPVHVDVVVVGSGYTGLHAAIQTARAGRSTLVLDAEAELQAMCRKLLANMVIENYRIEKPETV